MSIVVAFDAMKPSARRAKAFERRHAVKASSRVDDVVPRLHAARMGFLKPQPRVEAWLREGARGCRALSEREYRALVARWRAAFEPGLAAGEVLSGEAARSQARAALPLVGFVFSLPGYPHLPSPTDAQRDPAWGYEVTSLSMIDFDVANSCDAIIVNEAFDWSCLCTHESGAFAEPQFVRSSEG